MPHPLRQKIAELRRRVTRLVALYGVSRVVTTVLLAVLLVGLADYLVRFQDPGIRLIASVAVAVVLGWTCYRYLYLGLSVRFRDVDLARRVQRRYPALGDELASAVEFLDQSEDDATAGSVALRRTVIARASAETDPLDFRDALEPGPSRRAAVVAAALTLLAAAVVVLAPRTSGIALARLANPFGTTAWPQTTHLMLRRPVDRVAKGRPFEVEVVDRDGAELPPEVHIHYRLEDAEGNITEETQLMHFIDGAMVARRENVTRPFSYRVEGGDDRSMPWIPVEVLEPPAVASLSIKLIPPDYTGWPADWADGHIRALVGTRAEFSATATKPLVSAVLAMEDGRRVPASLASGGRRFTVGTDGAEPVLIETSGGYWLELTDTEGLTAGPEARWEVRAVEDAPPSVSIERPTSTAMVTSEAVLPIRVAVKDDLAIRDVLLQFERSDRPREDPGTVLLEEGPPRPRPSADPSGGPSGESRVVTYDWQLASLGLSPSTQVTFRGAATDYRPQTGQSEPRRLIVITPEELVQRIASRQAFILSELARVLEMQRQSRRQVAALEIQLGEVGQFDQRDVDHLRGADLTQRQVTRTLTSPSEGVVMHIAGLLADLRNNKVDSPDVRRRMEEVLAEIERLGREPLPIIARELTSAIKAATVDLQDVELRDIDPQGAETPTRSEPDAAVADPLLAAGTGQDEVIASLEQLLGQLARWDDFRQFHRDVGHLLRQQEELGRRTAELARQTLTKRVEDLLPQESADLKIATREQFEIARRLDRIQQGMQAAVGRLEPTDPLAAETLSDALWRAAELAVGGTMRTAAGQIEQNRMGQAIRGQKQAVENLREILDILSNRREHELARLVRKLRQAEADLADLARRQEQIKNQLEQAADEPDEQGRRRQLERLHRQQEQLREETERIERRLERLLAEATAKTLGQAAEKMQAAGECAAGGEGSGACRQAGEARKKLEEARRQLAQKRRQAELELAAEMLARIEDKLQGLRRRQQSAADETVRLEDLSATQGRLTDAQLASLGQLARGQRLLRDETAGLFDELVGAAVFRLALSDVGDQMGRAAALLDRRQTGPPTQTAQQVALARLDQLLEAVRPDEPEQKPGESGAGQGGQPSASPGKALQAVAELKLLKLLQEEVNLRTRKLATQFGKAENLPDQARREYAELSRQQGRLADLLLNLVPLSPDVEESP